MKSLIAPIAIMGFLFTVNAQAEGGCPPGMVPYNSAAAGSATSMASCGPIPQTHPPAPRWISRWGAVADDGNGVYGVVTDQRSERAAKKAAIKQCTERGGTDCNAFFTYRDQCAVIVGTDTDSIVQGAATEEIAEAAALTQCRAEGSKKCWVYYSGCSLPVRVN